MNSVGSLSVCPMCIHCVNISDFHMNVFIFCYFRDRDRPAVRRLVMDIKRLMSEIFFPSKLSKKLSKNQYKNKI